MTLHVRFAYLSLYLCAKYRSCTLAGFCWTFADAEKEEEGGDDDDDDDDEETTRATPIY